MNYDTDKHCLIGNILNRENQFITTVEPNLNSYFNKIMNFPKPFATIIVKYKTGFLYDITRWTIINYLHVTTKEKSTACSYGIMGG